MKRREELDKYRDMGDDELRAEAARLRESLFRLNFKLSLGEVDAVKRIRQEKKALARIQTISKQTRVSQRRGCPSPAKGYKNGRETRKLTPKAQIKWKREVKVSRKPSGKSRNSCFRQDDEDRCGSRGPAGASSQVSTLRAPHVEVHGP